MHDANSIDVVIPSFRLDEEILLSIFNLPKPEFFSVRYYLVADNPAMVIPDRIFQLAIERKIILIQNEVNLGFSLTRNKGIRLGDGKWLLLLDDDVVPDKKLLIAYANAIHINPNALGFAGVTYFPEPFDLTTKALKLNGSIGHCESATRYDELMWVPTTNVMLNRELMDPTLFKEDLKKGGEDIEFLVRNAKRNRKKYLSVPDAVVQHPWWEGGLTQRQYRYGAGAAQIAPLPAIKEHTNYDFTNTSETLLLLIVFSPLIILNFSWSFWGMQCLMTVGIELLINLARGVYLSGRFSLAMGGQLFWIKNCYEAGFLAESIFQGRLSGFAQRIDMGFSKKNPSWFRLNKWKIAKLCLMAIVIWCLIN